LRRHGDLAIADRAVLHLESELKAGAELVDLVRGIVEEPVQEDVGNDGGSIFLAFGELEIVAGHGVDQVGSHAGSQIGVDAELRRFEAVSR
jgi:hypothetical protein